MALGWKGHPEEPVLSLQPLGRRWTATPVPWVWWVCHLCCVDLASQAGVRTGKASSLASPMEAPWGAVVMRAVMPWALCLKSSSSLYSLLRFFKPPHSWWVTSSWQRFTKDQVFDFWGISPLSHIISEIIFLPHEANISLFYFQMHQYLLFQQIPSPHIFINILTKTPAHPQWWQLGLSWQ